MLSGVGWVFSKLTFWLAVWKKWTLMSGMNSFICANWLCCLLTFCKFNSRKTIYSEKLHFFFSPICLFVSLFEVHAQKWNRIWKLMKRKFDFKSSFEGLPHFSPTPPNLLLFYSSYLWCCVLMSVYSTYSKLCIIHIFAFEASKCFDFKLIARENFRRQVSIFC